MRVKGDFGDCVGFGGELLGTPIGCRAASLAVLTKGAAPLGGHANHRSIPNDNQRNAVGCGSTRFAMSMSCRFGGRGNSIGDLADRFGNAIRDTSGSVTGFIAP